MRVAFRLISYEIVPGNNGQQVIRITVDPKGNELRLKRRRPKTGSEELDVHTLSFLDSVAGTLFSLRAIDPSTPTSETRTPTTHQSQEPPVKKELTLTDQDGTLAEEIITYLGGGGKRPDRSREIVKSRFHREDVTQLIDSAMKNNNFVAGLLGLNSQVRDFVLEEIQRDDQRGLKAWIGENKGDGKFASGLLQDERIRKVVLG